MIGRSNISNSVRIPVNSPMHKIGLPSSKSGNVWDALAPSDLAVVVDSDTAMTVSWTNNDTKGDGTKLEMSSDGGSTYEVIATLELGVATYTKTGLTANTLYYFRVRAFKN
jgi:hypothetical protein